MFLKSHYHLFNEFPHQLELQAYIANGLLDSSLLDIHTYLVSIAKILVSLANISMFAGNRFQRGTTHVGTHTGRIPKELGLPQVIPQVRQSI